LKINDSTLSMLNTVKKYRNHKIHGQPLQKVENVDDEQVDEYFDVIKDGLKLVSIIERINIQDQSEENKNKKRNSVVTYFLHKLSQDQREKVIPTLESLLIEIKNQKITREEILDRLGELEKTIPEKDKPWFKKLRDFLSTAAAEGVIEEIIGLILRVALNLPS
jgi:hypothetical protein